MTISIQPDPATETAMIQFTLPQDHPDGPVSVVGSFNDWTPRANPLRPQPDGTLSASVTVTAGQDVHFRYLDSAGIWFDDSDSHEITPDGGVLHLDTPSAPGPTIGPEEPTVPASPKA